MNQKLKELKKIVGRKKSVLERIKTHTHTAEDARLIRQAFEALDLFAKDEFPGVSLPIELRSKLFKDNEKNPTKTSKSKEIKL